MAYKGKLARLFSLLMAVALLMSMTVTAGAVDIDEAKNSVAKVEIAQTYNGAKNNDATHNYATSGSEVDITYEATLYMTDVMAAYLQARQRQLLDAKFNINIDMDLDALEFTAGEDTVTVTFTSTFLKPQDSGDYTYVLTGYDEETKVFTYEITAAKSWALAQDEANGVITIPAELITYYDSASGAALNREETEARRAELADEKLQYADYTVDDWMYEIKAAVAELAVKDEVRQEVISGRGSRTIVASGTVDGYFTYGTEVPVNTIADFSYNQVETTLHFGPDEELPAWTSNEVKVTLTYYAPVIPDIPDTPDTPYLNTEDHFAYIIGYPEGDVRPQGSITRAEVATIFFRMLNDETRNEYWSQTNSYSDVSLDDWFNNAISTLSNLGILTGYEDGSFRPNNSITRAEFATIAVRFFTNADELTWEKDFFTDIGGHWANDYINAAYLLEVISGYPDGTYRPDNAITRAEAMTIVNNTLRRSPVKEGLLPVSEMITWPDNMDTSAWYYEAVQEATNSHLYTYSGDSGDEQWTEPLPVRDWVAFEKAWSDANSASNPGEVVDSD